MPLGKAERDYSEICFGTSCSFCERGCPIYQALLVRTMTSRGKNRIILGLTTGRIKPSKELADAVLICTGCGNCDRWCALPNTKNFRKLREHLIECGFESDVHKKNLSNIQKFGNPYGSGDKAAWQGKFRFSPKSKTLLFAGCTMPLKEQKALDSIIGILGPERLSVMKDEPCCGSYLMRTGYIGQHEKLVDSLAEYIDKNKIEEVVAVCAGCYSTLKETLAEKRPKIRVLHTVEKIADDLKSGRLKLKKKYGKITYHDPCHLGRLGGVFEPPREILSQTGELVEMPHNRFESRCCGAGAGVRAAYPKVAETVGEKRVKEAKDTGADVLVSACPFCEGLFKAVGGIKVKDIFELVEECKDS